MQISIEGVSKRFGSVTALEDVSLSVEHGELFFLLGPSGCGKTTLLRILAGFSSVDSGRVLFDGDDVAGIPPHKRSAAMVFQGYALWPHMTVRENVAFGLEMRRVPKAEREEKVATALARVQISELADRKPHELSGGQQQRVALARTLVVEPACLLLDEPLANLDARLRLDMRAEIRRICKESGLTAVYVTHDQKEALSMADRLAVLKGGHALQVGRPRDVYTRPADHFVAGFIGEANFLAGTVAGVDGGTGVVETEVGRIASAVLPDNAEAGRPVVVCLRPEGIRRCGDGEATAGNAFQARVTGTVYLGDLAHYRLAVGESTTLHMAELNPRSVPAEGETMPVCVDPRDAIVLPSEE